MTSPAVRGVVTVAFALVLGACGGDDTSESVDFEHPPVEIGVITDLTGPRVAVGLDIRQATELAVAEVNDSGGINGSELRVTIVDTASEVDNAVTGFRNLADAGVLAVSGPLSSREADILFPEAASRRLPIVTGTANKEDITRAGAGWAFRNTATNLELFSAAMPKWQDEYAIKTAVVVYDEVGPAWVDAATNAIPDVAAAEGITIVNEDEPVTFQQGDTDFTVTVQRIKEHDSDGVIVISNAPEAGLLARELAQQDLGRAVLGHPAQAAEGFFSQGGEDIDEWVLPLVFDSQSTEPAAAAYQAAMSEDGDELVFAEAANYYDTVKLLAEVMINAGINGATDVEDARLRIRDGLLGLEGFVGITGVITFDDAGNAAKEVYVKVVELGDMRTLD